MTLTVSSLEDEQYKSSIMEYMSKRRIGNLALFVEGEEDVPFYGNILDNIIEDVDKKTFFICNGKKRVYQVYEYIENNLEYSDKRLYFVDKDLSDILPDDPTPVLPGLYVTGHYSIENYIADRDVLYRLVRDVYRLHNITWEEISSSYDNLYSSARTVILDIMCWIIAQRKKGYRPTLADKKLDALISVDNNLNLVVVDDSVPIWESFGNLFSNSLEITQNEIDSEKEILEAMTDKSWMRGKYEYWIFFNFIDKFSSHFKSIDPNKRIVPKMPAQGNAIAGHLFPRCLANPELKNFIRDNLEL